MNYTYTTLEKIEGAKVGEPTDHEDTMEIESLAELLTHTEWTDEEIVQLAALREKEIAWFDNATIRVTRVS
jgi:hypothetical protein